MLTQLFSPEIGREKTAKNRLNPPSFSWCSNFAVLVFSCCLILPSTISDSSPWRSVSDFLFSATSPRNLLYKKPGFRLGANIGEKGSIDRFYFWQNQKTTRGGNLIKICCSGWCPRAKIWRIRYLMGTLVGKHVDSGSEQSLQCVCRANERSCFARLCEQRMHHSNTRSNSDGQHHLNQ